MNNFYFLKPSLLIVSIIGFTFNVTFLHAQHLFSVSYNDLSKENVAQLKSQIVDSEVSTLSLTKNKENKDVYPVAFSSEEDAKIIILDEQTGNNVVITPADESLTEFQLAPFFIEELRQGILGDATRYVVLETANDFSVKSVSTVSATKNAAYIPQYFYGKKENVKEALPKERQIIHIFKEKPQLILADPNDSKLQHYAAQWEEEKSYYVYMYKLPDGGLWIYDEHFNINNEPETRTGFNLPFTLSGNLNANQQAATLYALDIWSEVLTGIIPVDINVRSVNMGGGGVIGGSYRTPNYWNPETQTWYCSALGNQMAGYNVVPSQRDIRLEMNSQFNFYYDTTGNPGSNQMDWITIMLHEVCHGLGFYGLVGNNGNYSYTTSNGGSGSTSYPSSYDRQLYQGATGDVCLTDLTTSQRAALVKSNNLYAGAPGSNLLAATEGNRIQMYAPSSWASGSSVSHWDQNVTFTTFMRPFANYAWKLHTIGTRKIGMMLDLGWPPSFVPVTDIVDVPTISFVDTLLILTGTVIPNNANNQTISWGIDDAGTTGATLTSDTLNTTQAGIIIVTATIENGINAGTDYVQHYTITVKTAQTAPDAPTLASNTSTSITLNVMEGCEFRMDDNEWQISTLFDSLSPNTEYTFVARKAETETHFASPESPTVQFSTPPVTYTITATVNNPNFGTIDPDGETVVVENGSVTYTITPYTEYEIYDVLVNGVSQGEIITYTFEDVQSDGTISVEFGLGINENEFSDVRVYSYRNIIHINDVGARRTLSLQVEIMDMMGRVIHKDTITNTETAITLPVASGIYTVRLISQEGNTATTKVSISN